MFGYRLSKYDPAKRDASGAYLVEDWTSVSDIGRSLNGRIVTTQQYLVVEDSYVNAVAQLLSFAGISTMYVSDLEVMTSGHDTRFPDDGVAISCAQLHDTSMVAGEMLERVVRGCLREYVWCRLSTPCKSYVHFGYDYYVYVGIPDSASSLVLPTGMFIEECDSPYMEIDE